MTVQVAFSYVTVQAAELNLERESSWKQCIAIIIVAINKLTSSGKFIKAFIIKDCYKMDKNITEMFILKLFQKNLSFNFIISVPVALI